MRAWRFPAATTAMVSAAVLLSSLAEAQLAVSSNDNKVRNVEGINTVVRNAPPDTVSVIDLGASPPRIVGEVKAPGSWASPPQSVAVSPDETIALVTASTRIDPSDAATTVPDDTVTVIDLKSHPPRSSRRCTPAGGHRASRSIRRAHGPRRQPQRRHRLRVCD